MPGRFSIIAILVTLSAFLISPLHADNLEDVDWLGAEIDPDIWGTPEQGWGPLTEYELSGSSITIGLNRFSMMLTEPYYIDLLREVANMGPRPIREDDRDGYFEWNDTLEREVLDTRFRPGNADDWYDAYVQLRLLRLFEMEGFRVVDMEPVHYNDLGYLFYFVLVRE